MVLLFEAVAPANNSFANLPRLGLLFSPGKRMISPVKILVATALAATVAEGHGWMSKPEAIFSNEAGDKTQFIGSIDSASTGFKGSFSTAPADNVASFTKAFAASKYKTQSAHRRQDRDHCVGSYTHLRYRYAGRHSAAPACQVGMGSLGFGGLYAVSRGPVRGLVRYHARVPGRELRR